MSFSMDRVAMRTPPVSLATGVLTCCRAVAAASAAGGWQAARKHPACMRPRILPRTFQLLAIPISFWYFFSFFFSLKHQYEDE